jgi:hypothetical protein
VLRLEVEVHLQLEWLHQDQLEWLLQDRLEGLLQDRLEGRQGHSEGNSSRCPL